MFIADHGRAGQSKAADRCHLRLPLVNRKFRCMRGESIDGRNAALRKPRCKHDPVHLRRVKRLMRLMIGKNPYGDPHFSFIGWLFIAIL